jgi:hypothetical protein
MNYLKNIIKFTLAIALLIPTSLISRDKTNGVSRYVGFSSQPVDYEEFNVNNWTIDTSNDGRIAELWRLSCLCSGMVVCRA